MRLCRIAAKRSESVTVESSIFCFFEKAHVKIDSGGEFLVFLSEGFLAVKNIIIVAFLSKLGQIAGAIRTPDYHIMKNAWDGYRHKPTASILSKYKSFIISTQPLSAWRQEEAGEYGKLVYYTFRLATIFTRSTLLSARRRLKMTLAPFSAKLVLVSLKENDYSGLLFKRLW